MTLACPLHWRRRDVAGSTLARELASKSDSSVQQAAARAIARLIDQGLVTLDAARVLDQQTRAVPGAGCNGLVPRPQPGTGVG
jgi:hypothetical protein